METNEIVYLVKVFASTPVRHCVYEYNTSDIDEIARLLHVIASEYRSCEFFIYDYDTGELVFKANPAYEDVYDDSTLGANDELENRIRAIL